MKITVRPKGTGFEARATVNNLQYSRWAKNEKDAQERLKVYLWQMRQNEPPRLTTYYISTLYLAALENRTPKYQEQARYSIAQFPNLMKMDVKDVKRPDVQSAFNDLVRRKNLSSGTLATFRKHLFGIFELAVDSEYCNRNPVRKIVLPREPFSPKQIFSPVEIGKLIVSSRGYSIHPFIVLGGCLGIGPGEVSKLEPQHISPRVLTIPGTKAKGRYRTLPFPGLLLEELGTDKFPFRYHSSNSNRSMREALQRAGLERNGRTLYSLRHSFATGLQELGATEEIRARLLGHAKSSITQHYSHAGTEVYFPWVESWVNLVYLNPGNTTGNSLPTNGVK